MIKINNLSFSYGDKKIFENFSLEIKNGGKICFFGTSGSGKTTLLRLIMGLEKPQSGEIIFETGNKISAVFQEDRLLAFLTVEKNIEIAGGKKESAEKTLNLLGLEEYKNKKPDDLSGGMKRRVALARALCRDFDILILDEPFNGLDSENIKTAANIINEFSAGKTVIIVTHFKEQAELLNAEIIDLNN
ncbi:MAG: ATP-binding cassette domain-containing protein [Clostridia bacterium]|nr:ATP-binding cassette domain-containing protein [Clostridia bacterium]